MKLKLFQKGFNYSQDGTGNRLVYHLQGCNMKCPWCANPEGMPVEGALMTDRDWLDDILCPQGAIRDKKLDRTFCKNCTDRPCITKQKAKGILLSCEEYEVDDLVEEVLRSSLLFYDGGGLTLTGGEVTMQFASVRELLEKVHDQGIHTAIETNATHPDLEELFPLVDELIMDCKQCNEEKHRKYTGLSNRTVLSNIRKAAKLHPNVHLRVPVIGGVNDSSEDEADFLTFFQEIKGPKVTFELLKYHEFGREKWKQCGHPYQMSDTAHVSQERITEFKDSLIKAGLTYRRT